MAQGVRRFHKLATGFSTVFPLWCLAYLVAHAYEHDAVREGRDALLARLAKSAHFELELTCVVLPIAVYAALFRARPTGHLAPQFVRIERVAGLLALLLLTFHLAHVWLPRWAARAPTPAYVAMLEATTTTAGVAISLLFVSATLVHLGCAVVPALDAVVPNPVWSRVLAIALTSGLWLWFVDILSAYSGGAPLL